jgi:hypothetical protein
MDAFDRELLAATQQRSEAWNDIRLGRFTSSEIYKLMGKSDDKFTDGAMTYINQKVSEVLTGQKKQDVYAYAKEYGKEMEPVAIKYFIESKGFAYDTIGFVAFGDHAGCSPDGKINEHDNLEVKCPLASENHIEHLLLKDQSELKKFRPQYYWQAMSALLFTGAPQCHWISYDPRMQGEKLKMAYIIVTPDQKDFDLLIKQIKKAVEKKLSIIQSLQS